MIKYQTLLEKTRTKTSIRYAKENDIEKREREKVRRRDIDREEEKILREISQTEK